MTSEGMFVESTRFVVEFMFGPLLCALFSVARSLQISPPNSVGILPALARFVLEARQHSQTCCAFSTDVSILLSPDLLGRCLGELIVAMIYHELIDLQSSFLRAARPRGTEAAQSSRNAEVPFWCPRSVVLRHAIMPSFQELVRIPLYTRPGPVFTGMWLRQDSANEGK